MNLMSAIEAESLIGSVLFIIVLGVVFWLLFWLIGYLAPPEPFAKVAKVILAVAAVLILINCLLSMVGHPIIVWKK